MTRLQRSVAPLFEPFSSGKLRLPNRIVMAPMTRRFSPNGIAAGPATAEYYARRARGGVGLVITEGIAPPHPVSEASAIVPKISGEESIAPWREVVRAVHAAGSLIFMQIWHTGLGRDNARSSRPELPSVGPSGFMPDGLDVARRTMTQSDIDAVIESFAAAAEAAKAIGFDGVNIHGAHGYILDQFFWDQTNLRTDVYGGDLVQRTRFATELIAEMRRRTGPDFPIMLRFSQWKVPDYEARLVDDPKQLAAFLEPLVRAGVTMFDVSTRRFWLPAFKDSDLTLAAWTKKVSGVTTMMVGCVSLEAPRALKGPDAATGAKLAVENIDLASEMIEQGQIDLVGVGRMLLANPSWPKQVEKGAFDELRPYHPKMLDQLESSEIAVS